jgi:hypothetical protein
MVAVTRRSTAGTCPGRVCAGSGSALPTDGHSSAATWQALQRHPRRRCAGQPPGAACPGSLCTHGARAPASHRMASSLLPPGRRPAACHRRRFTVPQPPGAAYPGACTHVAATARPRLRAALLCHLRQTFSSGCQRAHPLRWPTALLWRPLGIGPVLPPQHRVDSRVLARARCVRGEAVAAAGVDVGRCSSIGARPVKIASKRHGAGATRHYSVAASHWRLPCIGAWLLV